MPFAHSPGKDTQATLRNPGSMSAGPWSSGSGGAARGQCRLPPAEPHKLAPWGAGWPLRILSDSGRDWCAAPRGASVSLRYFSAGCRSGWSSGGRNMPGASQDAAGGRGADSRDASARTEPTPASKPRQSSDPSCHPKDVPSPSPCSAPNRKRSRVDCGEAVKACGQSGGQTAAPEPRGFPSPEPQGPRSHWPRVGWRGGHGEAGPPAQPSVTPMTPRTDRGLSLVTQHWSGFIY